MSASGQAAAIPQTVAEIQALTADGIKTYVLGYDTQNDAILKQALDSTEQRDITSSCMVAMAKIGKNPKDFNILDVFRARLTSASDPARRWVRSTACRWA